MNLTRLNWPHGWTPGADPVNGDPNGLLRMDNLQMDETGATTLVRGLKILNAAPLSDFVDVLYSKLLNNKDVLWAALNNESTSVIRTNSGDFTDAITVCNGNSRTAFGDALGQVLVCSGTPRKKDNGTKIQDLGLQTPGKPVVTTISQPTLAFYPGPGGSSFVTQRTTGTWSMVEGQPVPIIDGNGIFFFQAPSNEGIARLTFAGPTDTTNIGGSPSGSVDTAANDTFQITITPDDPSVVTSVRVDFILNTDFTHIEDYYTYTWDGSLLLQGPLQSSVLTATRGQFTRNSPLVIPLGPHLPSGRSGTNPQLNWTTVNAIMVTVETTALIGVNYQFPAFVGGPQGQLSGTYQWIQVNINDTGAYVGKSPTSGPSDQFTLSNGSATLVPSAVEDQVTGIRFFRISVNNGTTDALNQYYLVGEVKPGVTFVDSLSDEAAIQNGSLDPSNGIANLFLKSLQPLTDGNGLPSPISGMEGMIGDRFLYMDFQNIYISDRLNLDAVDARYTIKAFGDATESNLWIKKLTNNVVILGTTKNLYELTGTFEPQPDGTIDINVIGIGEAHPPLTRDCAATQGFIFYCASDGIRGTGGSNSVLLSPQLSLLFQGEARQGIAPIVISPFARYALTFGKNKLFCGLPTTDGKQPLFIFDWLLKTWGVRWTDPITLFTTLQTDRVLLGYNTGSDSSSLSGNVVELDVGAGVINSDGSFLHGFPLYFQTVFDANGQPRNRKDTFTLKLIVDTGGDPVSVYIGKDRGSLTFLENVTTNGLETVYIPLNEDDVTLGFRYQIKIVDVNLISVFRLYEMTIEYDPRPEQLNYLRIQPSNLGTISRKRIVNYAFVIDTLGNNVGLNMLVDNASASLVPRSSTVNTSVKQTYIHYFTAETIGTDISGILTSFDEGPFEFYGLNVEEIISEKLPVPVKFLVIPANNYGSPNRKRHTSYKFQIDTRGKLVSFTPILDGIVYQSTNFRTPTKQTVEYFFPTSAGIGPVSGDVIGIDIGGTLQTVEDTPFEFYGVVTPQQIEELPPRLEAFRIPNTNFGVASRKRMRTLPMVINTNGLPVTFTPIVDGVAGTPSQLFGLDKTTTFHYFTNDSFGIDYGGMIKGAIPFEFYGWGEPEQVETLPVGKKYDQLGPTRFDKIGKVFSFRVRLIMTGTTTSIPWAIYADTSTSDPTYGVPKFTGSINVTPMVDYIYEIQLPKSINCTVFRLVLGPTNDPFHRYDVTINVTTNGMETSHKWIPIR